MTHRRMTVSAAIATALVLSLPETSIAQTAFRPFGQAQELVASDLAPGDRFGGSFAVSGDLAVVGADRSDSFGLVDAGAAYIFQRTGGRFEEIGKLTARNPQADAWFGASVRFDGKLLVIGAPGEDRAGAAYVYRWDGAAMHLEAHLLGSDTEAGDRFGAALALGDGRVLVTASADGHSGVRGAGSAYLFESIDGQWHEKFKLIAEDPFPDGGLGTAAILTGDQALISAARIDAVYVFTLRPRGWLQLQKLMVVGNRDVDSFGASMSVHGNTLLVSAPTRDHAGMIDAGAAHVLARSTRTGLWIEKQSVAASQPWNDAWYGSGAALADGLAVVGASSRRSERTGMAFVYQREGGRWAEQQMLVARDVATFDRFGSAVALDGDTLLVGAERHDHDRVEDCGAVYVFTRASAPAPRALTRRCVTPDVTAPIVSCNVPESIGRSQLPMTFTATAVDDCGPAPVTILDPACRGEGGCEIATRGSQISLQRVGRDVTGVTWRAQAIDQEGNSMVMRCQLTIENR